MAVRSYKVYVTIQIGQFVGVWIEAFENGNKIGSNCKEVSCYGPYGGIVGHEHIAYWEFCWEKYTFRFYDAPGGNPYYITIEVTCQPPGFNDPSLPDLYTLTHSHTDIQPPPPPPPVQPPPGPPPPIPIEPPPTLPPERPPTEEPPFKVGPPPTLPPDRPPSGRMVVDIYIWNKFISRFGEHISRWALEVPLDWGDEFGGREIPEQYKAMWQRLTQHKADCVIDFKGVIYVCEIKPRLTLAALGQAYFGWQLFLRRYRVDKPSKPAVICQTAPLSLLQIAAQNGITVFVVEEITPSAGVKEWIE